MRFQSRSLAQAETLDALDQIEYGAAACLAIRGES